jgi:hypothetical protein
VGDGFGLNGLEGEELSPEWAHLHREPETWKRLAAGNVAQLEGEALER